MAGYTPKDGYERNPLLRFNRNIPCLCGSNKKIKKCCGRGIYVLTDFADKINNIIKGLSVDELKMVGIK